MGVDCEFVLFPKDLRGTVEKIFNDLVWRYEDKKDAAFPGQWVSIRHLISDEKDALYRKTAMWCSDDVPVPPSPSQVPKPTFDEFYEQATKEYGFVEIPFPLFAYCDIQVSKEKSRIIIGDGCRLKYNQEYQQAMLAYLKKIDPLSDPVVVGSDTNHDE